MIVAEVRYRLYVPFGWIAVEFCNVEFHGANADKLTSDWNIIEYKRYEETKSAIENQQEKLDAMIKEETNLLILYKESKPWWRFWNNKSEKNILKKIDYLQTEIDRISKTLEEMESKRFYSAYELKIKLHDFLRKNGFLLKNHNTDGLECKTDIEIWEK